MEILPTITTTFIQAFLVPIKKHLGFFVYFSKKAKDMHSRATDPEGEFNDMKTRIQSVEANRRVVPPRARRWLTKADDVRERATGIQADGVGCFNIKTRYKARKDSCDILKDINRLMKEKAEMVWPNEMIPLFAVPSTTQEEDRDQNRFESRYNLLTLALKYLGSTDISSQKMALCGMGGIGKTTMMEEIKKAARSRHMFDHIVKVVVGEKPNLAVVQQAIKDSRILK